MRKLKIDWKEFRVTSNAEASVQVTLSQFLERLFEEGRVTVSAPEPVQADELQAAEATLAALEAVYRLDLPGEPRRWRCAAARWAAVSLFHACQFVAFRNAGEEMIAAALRRGPPFPRPQAASLHYSVDLTFRFLPDLMRLARTDAENDPLLGYLRQWAIDWPLVVGRNSGRNAKFDRTDCQSSLSPEYLSRSRHRPPSRCLGAQPLRRPRTGRDAPAIRGLKRPLRRQWERK